jgi:hypothetical protein
MSLSGIDYENTYIACYRAYKNRDEDPEDYVLKYTALLMCAKEFSNKPTKFMDMHSVFLASSKIMLAGGAAIFLHKQTEHNVPTDLDFWVPREISHSTYVSYFEQEGWREVEYHEFNKNIQVTASYITRVTDMRHPDYSFEIQFIGLRTNFEAIYETYDFDVSNAVYSPVIHEDGNAIGLRATKPKIRDAILNGVATYRENTWDLDGDNLSLKSIGRIMKYVKKGFRIEVFVINALEQERLQLWSIWTLSNKLPTMLLVILV